MSLQTLLGPRAPLLDRRPRRREAARARELLPLPVGTSLAPPEGSRRDVRDESLASACSRLSSAAVAAARDGAACLLLDDAATAEGRLPLPALLAVAAVHRALVEEGLRTSTSLVVASDEPREVHHFACLIGYGADAVCPRLALETVADLGAADKLGGATPDEATAELPPRGRGRRPQGDGEDGHLRRRLVPRRRGVRGDRPRGRRARDVLPAHAGDRRPGRVRGARARCSRAARGRALGGAGAREPRVREVPQGRRASCDEPRGRRRAAAGRGSQASLGGERHGLGRLRTVRAARQRARAARAARPARARPRRRAGSARGGRARRVDPAPLLERRHVARLALRRGARDRGDRLQPARRALELGRRRRGSRALRRRAELPHQADRFGPLRCHRALRGLRRRAPDQDRAGLEARRGRPAPGAQGQRGDRAPATHAAGHRAHLAAAASRHLLDRGPRAARLRPEAGEPGRGRLGQARLRGRRRAGRRRCREGARRRRARRRSGRRDRRQPTVVDQERGCAVGARARRDAADARRRRSARPGSPPRRRRAEDGPGRRGRRAARRRRGVLRHGRADRAGLPDGALVPPRHLSRRDRDATARAAREVRRDAGARRGVPPLRRGRGAAAPREPRPQRARRGRRPLRPAAPARGRSARGRGAARHRRRLRGRAAASRSRRRARRAARRTTRGRRSKRRDCSTCATRSATPTAPSAHGSPARSRRGSAAARHPAASGSASPAARGRASARS